MSNRRLKALAAAGVALATAAALAFAFKAVVVTGGASPVTTADGGPSQTGPTVMIESGQLAVGGTDVTRLWALNVGLPGLCALTIDVYYDPDVKVPTGCDADPGNKLDVSFCNKDHPDNKVRVMGVHTGGVTGSIPLADITWAAVGGAGDSTNLTVDIVSFEDCSGTPIPATPVNGTNVILTPTPTPTPRPSPSPKPSPSPTATPSSTPTPTSTVSPTATAAPTSTATPTATPTTLPGITMQMVAGWNHKCYVGDVKTMEAALDGIVEQVLAVYVLRPSQQFDRWFPGRPDVSNVAALNAYEALFLLMAADATWTQGLPGPEPASGALAQGWNSVCYTGATKPPEDATAGIAGEFAIFYTLSSDQAWGRYVPGRPEVSNIAQLAQYDAVLLLVTEPGGTTWTFDP